MEVTPMLGDEDENAAMLENTSGEPLPNVRTVTPARSGGIRYFSTIAYGRIIPSFCVRHAQGVHALDALTCSTGQKNESAVELSR